MTPDWHPIDTAPRGTRVLLWVPIWRCPFPGQVLGEHGESLLESHGDGDDAPLGCYPTHWMPLPDPPRALGTAGEHHALTFASVPEFQGERRLKRSDISAEILKGSQGGTAGAPAPPALRKLIHAWRDAAAYAPFELQGRAVTLIQCADELEAALAASPGPVQTPLEHE